MAKEDAIYQVGIEDEELSGDKRADEDMAWRKNVESDFRTTNLDCSKLAVRFTDGSELHTAADKTTLAVEVALIGPVS